MIKFDSLNPHFVDQAIEAQRMQVTTPKYTLSTWRQQTQKAGSRVCAPNTRTVLTLPGTGRGQNPGFQVILVKSLLLSRIQVPPQKSEGEPSSLKIQSFIWRFLTLLSDGGSLKNYWQ